jgi:hypothetical protein
MALKDLPFRMGPTRMICGPTSVPSGVSVRHRSRSVSFPPMSRNSVMPSAVKRGKADAVVQLICTWQSQSLGIRCLPRPSMTSAEELGASSLLAILRPCGHARFDILITAQLTVRNVHHDDMAMTVVRAGACAMPCARPHERATRARTFCSNPGPASQSNCRVLPSVRELGGRRMIRHNI